MPTDVRFSKFLSTRRGRRAQTLAEVLIAIALMSVIVVFITADLTNVTKTGQEADRSIEIAAGNYLLGVMKSDQSFWGQNGETDWGSGPSDTCLHALGPYTDQGPSASPSPDWHTMPSAVTTCQTALPFSDLGAPQDYSNGNASAAPVGDVVQYMWNASEHNNDPSAADLTVWVRRDPNSPVFEYHAIRYTSPNAIVPTGSPAASSSPGGGGGGGGHSPAPSPSSFGI